MKPRAWALFVTVAVAATSARAQGTFQNLDFEAARVVPLDNPVFIATSNALPGWTAFLGTNQQSSILLNVGYHPLTLNEGNFAAIDGFSVALDGLPTEGTASISQTGLVPAGARSLQFKVGYDPTVSYKPTDIVSLGGQSLPLVMLSSGSAITLFGADISRFAGQTETLSFYSTPGIGGGPFALDDIEFSPQIVPEPSVLALAALGFAALLVFRQKGRRRGEQAGSPINHAETKWSPSSGSGSCV